MKWASTVLMRAGEQIINETDAPEVAEAIVKQHGILGSLTYVYIKEVDKQEKCLARGESRQMGRSKS